MKLILFIHNLYIAVHTVYWFLQETNRRKNCSLYAILSHFCYPFCRLFRTVELRIRGKDAPIAVPVLALAMNRLSITALS